MAIRNLLQDSMVDDMGDADNQLTSLAPVSQKATVDPTIVNALKKQILAQNTSSKWQGGVDAETAANDMAKIMAGIGITDIRQFGIIEQVAPEEVKQDGKGGYVDQQGRPVDPSIVTPQSYQTEGGEISYFTAPIGKIQNFGNKTTGQLVPNTYGERQGGNAFGGTYEGKGNTGYRVDFTPDGTPIFYTTGASSSDVQDWMPLLQLGLAVTGAGGLLGNALLGGGSQVASSMLGNAILGGVTTGIAGGDILKGALTAGAAAGIAPATEMVLGKIPDFNSLPSSVKAAVTSAVSGTIMNKGEITPTVLASALAAGLGAAGKDADLAKFESERTESGLAGQTSLTEEDMRKLGIVSDANLPSGTQVAGPMTLNVGGVPIYAESSGASAIRPPAGYEVMSATLADNKPAGAYYDASINAWLQPTNEFAKVTDIDRLIADMETFKSGINTLDANAVKGIVDQSLSALPTLTADDITKIISSQNFATPQDIQTAINSINIPQGLSEQDVQSIVSNAFASNPNLTTEQVSQIVNSAVANIPTGLTANDVQSIVSSAVSQLPAAPTTQDIVNIIGGQGLASTSQLTQQGKDLMAALQQQGLDYNTALNEALKTQSGQFNTSITDVVNQIGGVQTGLESQLSAQGKQLMDSLQQQGLDYQTALNEVLASQASQFQNQIAGVQTGLESQLDAQGKQFLEALQARGVDYKTALDEAIAQQNAKIGEVQTSFEEQLAKSTASTSADFAKLMQTLGLMGTTINAIQAANTPKTYTYNLADPSTWGSPVYNQTTGPVTPITPLDFGTRDLLKGTQWEKFLDPNYGKVLQPVQFNQPSSMSYDRLMSVLGTGRDTLPSQALSINDVISGIQNQYGQAPQGTMG